MQMTLSSTDSVLLFGVSHFYGSYLTLSKRLERIRHSDESKEVAKVVPIPEEEHYAIPAAN